jgi:hypothetical protein
MEHFDPQSADNLERPINKGTLCAARFSDDGNWYRARLTGPTGGKQGKQYDVQFIDFGNKSQVNIDTDTKKLPAHLLAFEP